MSKAIFWLCTAVLLSSVADISKSDKYIYKPLAGPASEFMPLPNPEKASVTSELRFLPTANLISGSSGNSVYKTTFLADGEVAFAVAVLCAEQSDLDRLDVVVTAPSGVTAEPIRVDDGPFGMDGHTYPSRGFVYAYAEKGVWGFEMSMKDGEGQSPVKAFPFVAFPESVAVTMSADTLHTVVGETVQLRAKVDAYWNSQKTSPLADSSRMMKKSPRRLGLGRGVETVSLEVRSPSGQVTEEQMKPGDVSTNDEHIFTAPVQLSQAGNYHAVALVRGYHDDGEPFERSAWYRITAVDKTAELTGEVRVAKEENEFTNDEQFQVNLLLNDDLKPTGTYRVYAEIFSTEPNAANPSIPTAWIGGLSDVVQVSGHPALQVHLNTAWLASHHGPFELVNVRVEELTTYSSVTSASRLHLPLPTETVERLKTAKHRPITREMREGYHMQQRHKLNQASNHHGNITKSAAEGVLLLIHGYCSSVTPYTLEDFTNYVVFEDFKKSRPNDDFARLIIDAGKDYSSFGAVGHSQGGVALLHMLTYYSTPLDAASGERRLQTLASPYKGTPLSGLLAVIGDFFGVGCGDNPDLSYDSMSKWLSGIPAEKRNEVYYYTSQYETGHLINYCLLPSNLVLSWPNDGVVEDKAFPLDGGHHVEHTKGECHSDGMRSPPICKNHERNRLINALAAR